MWRAERKPWTLIDSDQDGGIYKTTDGGDNWEKLTEGLPEGVIGRIGFALARSPVVGRGALLRQERGGSVEPPM